MADNNKKPSLTDRRAAIRAHYLMDEAEMVTTLQSIADFTPEMRGRIAAAGAELVSQVRGTTTPGLMEAFLAEYGLSTREGVALMCLSEALLRVPDSTTIDELIEDKIAGGAWDDHLGQSISGIVNLSSYGLKITAGLFEEGTSDLTDTLRGLARRLGAPAVRSVVKLIMKELGRQFVLGETIEKATTRARTREAEGFRYSYDMLGEAAKTAADAETFFKDYMKAIRHLTPICKGDHASNPGISIKLSALHPRYEWAHRERVMAELAPKVLDLAIAAKAANMGLNIDAEEADRLDLSLDIIEHVLASPALAGWDGFGIVVQAYGKRAMFVLDHLYDLATSLDRKIMVRLVKGAYWDAEIKRAQVLGLTGYPVYTRKPHSDISYAAGVRKLRGMLDRIYPQFATHNAHTVATVLELFDGVDTGKYEFQRLHGMGQSIYDVMRRDRGINCRIYAPVGVHRDLLAYLVRRLLENGANSSFVNQLYDDKVSPEKVASDPFELAAVAPKASLPLPPALFGEDRVNAKGFDLNDPTTLDAVEAARGAFRTHQWQAGPLVAEMAEVKRPSHHLINPADPKDVVGTVTDAVAADIDAAFKAAAAARPGWTARPPAERAALLDRAADLMEARSGEIFALLAREAGKIMPDAVAELREAVDFLRYYAKEGRRHPSYRKPRGTFVCISPWNFPLAIFTGQIAAALATGNTVIAKPAEQTPLIAFLAVSLMHEAGVPLAVLQLLPGDGPTVGAPLTSHPDVGGVCFTGSTDTARAINRSVAGTRDGTVPLIAETGGLNAMIVDSTALPEQAVRDILGSAFQSAGQRCSALRILYLQEDIKDRFLTMLYGAMDELSIGLPWHHITDVGPVIDAEAYEGIMGYIREQAAARRVVRSLDVPDAGFFVPPTVVKVNGIEDMPREIFGPVLHIATFKAEELMDVVEAINAKGFGLTMGLHSRIDDRVAAVKAAAHVGNLYINRNQIGAVVGSQPFGGEGLSGTGPKAGGPNYLFAFTTDKPALPFAMPKVEALPQGELLKAMEALLRRRVQRRPDPKALLAAFASAFPDHAHELASVVSDLTEIFPESVSLPGPAGEDNTLTYHARGPVVVLGPDSRSLILQAFQALWFGNPLLAVANELPTATGLMSLVLDFPVEVRHGKADAAAVAKLPGITAVAYARPDDQSAALRLALADRDGALVQLIDMPFMPNRYVHERHHCTDTTASGGNVTLIAAGSSL
ncbi:bifunctional proline dehydrogenase/L-glutamate gamma-semialdehyde dehydrogenase PutA [Gimibacter soli]|uniref:Bifunctional protein PutA n=1 Tax=Gimibacter soli TaxID=3024400 RepID=A0AAF0BGR8_9PROT|nr:bifunctional proline dehydrogenase/L-glutamate gamma-semialdehyde dehydrogenase PutA [Gimibacter soli]WCL53803.1 bifunctional proline dehydrogenase/L-glutamate gamma-semialdehyde dehydrogenase PutA [Gimibacter soli]